MNSLYGGAPGAPFVIKKAFRSINEMLNAFKEGDNYTEVWYEEHCLIDTPNKNSEDNGKIYKRILPYLVEEKAFSSALENYATYLGQIVGPSAGAPYLGFSSLTNKSNSDLLDEIKNYSTGIKYEEDGSTSIIKTDNPVQTSTSGIEFITDSEEADQIKPTLQWVNIRNANNEAITSWCLIDLQIPYLSQSFVLDKPKNYVKFYEQPKIEEVKTNKEYYKKWKITLPKAVPADRISNIRIITLDDLKADKGIRYFTKDIFDNFNDSDKYQIDFNASTIKIDNKDYSFADLKGYTKFLVCDYIVCDIESSIEKQENTNKIYSVILDDYAEVLSIANHVDTGYYIKHSGVTDDAYLQAPYIKNITLSEGDGSKGGVFTFSVSHYKNLSEEDRNAAGLPKLSEGKYTSEISWLKNIEIDPKTGAVTETYAGTPDNKTESDKIKDENGVPKDGVYKGEQLIWPASISLKNGELKYTLTDNTDQSLGEIVYVEEIDNSGRIKYSNEEEEKTDTSKAKFIKVFNDISFKDNKDLYVSYYDNGEEKTEKLCEIDYVSELSFENGSLIKKYSSGGEEIFANNVSFLSSQEGDSPILFNITEEVSNDDGDFNLDAIVSGDQRIHVYFADGEDIIEEEEEGVISSSAEYISSPINYIADIVVENDTVYGLYSSPDARELGDEGDYTKPGWIKKAFSNSLANNTYNWKELGTIKSSGILIANSWTYNEFWTYRDEESGEDKAVSFDNTQSLILYLIEKLPYIPQPDSEDYLENAIQNGKVLAILHETENNVRTKLFHRSPSSNNWVYLGELSGNDSSNQSDNIVDITESSTIDSNANLVLRINSSFDKLVTVIPDEYWEN